MRFAIVFIRSFGLFIAPDQLRPCTGHRDSVSMCT